MYSATESGGALVSPAVTIFCQFPPGDRKGKVARVNTDYIIFQCADSARKVSTFASP